VLKKYSFPEKYQAKIEKALQAIGFSLSQPGRLAESVLKLSDHYQNKEKVTPWTAKETQAAYLAYYFPLNYIRNLKAFDAAKGTGFTPEISHILDFGFGLGSGYLAAVDSGMVRSSARVHAVDSSIVPLELFKNYLFDGGSEVVYADTFPRDVKFDLGLFSYSLNETPQVEEELSRIPNLMLIEPSTQWNGRQLMERRARLIERGYVMRAPCTHQGACPLLVHSKTDWCHDRVHWVQPPWWAALEKLLPIKNQTLTYSYLAASRGDEDSRETNGSVSNESSPYRGRVVGDELVEKGKSRWLFCRNEEREFLSWLNKSGRPPELYRGDLIDVEITEKKGNELRFKAARGAERSRS
jgi:hypothetical protein